PTHLPAPQPSRASTDLTDIEESACSSSPAVSTPHPTLNSEEPLYLLWLAVGTFRARPQQGGAAAATRSGGHWYLRGLAVSLTNPKLMLFFVAVLPGFLGHARSATAQMGMLGAVNIAMETLLYGSIGVFAGHFYTRVAGHGRGRRVLTLVAAGVYLLLAVVIGAEAVRDMLG
uniref:LysE family translocator n=1 Tax=Brachybacterium nesterenkovii TaxID=47847 RepID=UPI00321BD422